MSDNILNVSRRGFLQGIVSTGALILSVRLVPECLWADETLPASSRGSRRPASQRVCWNRHRRNRTSGGAPLGDGHQQPHFGPADSGR